MIVGNLPIDDKCTLLASFANRKNYHIVYCNIYYQPKRILIQVYDFEIFNWILEYTFVVLLIY